MKFTIASCARKHEVQRQRFSSTHKTI